MWRERERLQDDRDELQEHRDNLESDRKMVIEAAKKLDREVGPTSCASSERLHAASCRGRCLRMIRLLS